MPKLLASVQGLWGRLRPPVVQTSEPSLGAEPAVGAPFQRPTSRLANLSTEAIRATRIDFDNRLREVSRLLDEHRVETQSLEETYGAAEGDETRRRVLARQYQYLESRGQQLEERHDDLLLLLRQWDAIGQQQEKESWQQEDLRAAARVADATGLHEMMMESIARSEAWREDVQATVDAVDIASDKARNRRDLGLKTTMAKLDALTERQRVSQTTARQTHLNDVADGLDNLLERSVVKQQAQTVTEGRS